MTEDRFPDSLIRQWPPGLRVGRAMFLGNAGGFSGTRLWRFSGESDYCLRRWPSGVSEARVRRAHRGLARLADAGIDYVPVSYAWRDGSTAVLAAQHWWELTPWLPGTAAVERRPSPARIMAAMQGLARVHRAWAEAETGQTGHPIPTLHRRWQLAEQSASAAGMIHRRMDTLPNPLPWVAARMTDAIRQHLPRVQQRLQAASTCSVPLQLCIRDVRRDHLLFVGDRLTGIVDFAAMGRDSVATDLARLLAEWDPCVRQMVLDSYVVIRPLSDRECELCDLLRQVNPVLSGLQWLQWLVVEERSFDDWDAVTQRMMDCLESMGR